LSLERVEKVRLSDRIVTQLRTHILQGEWKPGEFLPPERELSTQLGVTRVSLREALRILEQEELIETRHGEGSLVRDFTRDAGMSALKYLAEMDLPQGDILRSALEVRVMIGAELVRAAALRASEADMAALEALIQEERSLMNDRAAVQRCDFQFYDLLAQSSGNIILKFLMNSVRETYLLQAHLFAELIGEPHEVIAYHEQLLRAIRRRDSARAARLAREQMSQGAQRFFSRTNYADQVE
jgi:GntR family transcriptional regulator, transcriptional repressor for pyruvate dehydrogenase complex